MLGHEIFPTHNHVKLHHLKKLCSITSSGNTFRQRTTQ